MADSKKRARDDPLESDLHSPEEKRIRTELLDIIDDADPDPAGQDLDTVIKSLEDELASSSSSPVCPPTIPDESRPDLGYLLEASDDELGLPPPPEATSAEEKNVGEDSLTEVVRVSSDSSGIREFWEFEDAIPSYDSFDLRVGEGYGIDYVALDGLFEYSDVRSDSSVLR